ncbi:DUF3667 domain-containing protein [Aequorivita sp. H23M31]|uniref:DUF3667 domain-containing protein n=1 Tax=Aequorivita ciconiae TaxID=2494375 RepID=A0A410G615_9FLAO|nr:DUF3667 domain-containing protein [Aequorivita sp. H23M31]QAA82709.1 DUF3667 domain-containing protein [Aequorivita sp. H23M31]
MERIEPNSCEVCGQNPEVPKIDWHYIASEIRSVFMLEKGFLYTVIQLLLKPGKAIKTYIQTDRRRLMKPIVFVILASLIYSLIDYYFPFQAKYMNHNGEVQNYTTSIAKWITENYGYSNLIMSIFIAGWLKLFFRKHPFSIFEMAVLLCYVMGMVMLLFAIFGFFEHTSNTNLVTIGSMVGFIYAVRAIGQVFGNKWFHYAKGGLAYIFGSISFTIIFLILGIVLDATLGNKAV